MQRVIERIHQRGFSEITIGIDNEEFEKLHILYSKFGFTEFVKETRLDLHYLDKNNKPVEFDEPCKIMEKETFTKSH